MTASILILLFIVLGVIYLYRRNRTKPSIKELLSDDKTSKLNIDEAFNLQRSQKEAELNKLLDKINLKGYDSLSSKEKEQLKELSK